MLSILLLCDSRQPLALSGPLQQSSHLILIIWKGSIYLYVIDEKTEAQGEKQVAQGYRAIRDSSPRPPGCRSMMGVRGTEVASGWNGYRP